MLIWNEPTIASLKASGALPISVAETADQEYVDQWRLSQSMLVNFEVTLQLLIEHHHKSARDLTGFGAHCPRTPALCAYHSIRPNAASRAAATKGILKEPLWSPRNWQLDCRDERRFMARQPPQFDRLGGGQHLGACASLPHHISRTMWRRLLSCSP